MKNVIVILKIESINKIIDIEVPLDITVNELIISIKNIYKLDMDIENIGELFIRCENPIGLLKGNRLLSECNIRNGSILSIKG